MVGGNRARVRATFVIVPSRSQGRAKQEELGAARRRVIKVGRGDRRAERTNRYEELHRDSRVCEG